MTCTDDRRREKVQQEGINGIDGVGVDGDRITVIFFGDAPEDLVPENFRIDGGRRITGIEVVGVHCCGEDDPELSGQVVLTVDRIGDLSTYRLSVVEVDSRGEPGTEPFPGFDPRYSFLDFTFTFGCEDLDCAPTGDSPSETYAEPEIDYLAKDYASFRQLLLDRLSLTTPRWTERHVPDLEVALVELLAYEGDRLSYRQDAVATEAYLDTARKRVSVRRHTRLVDYPMHDGCAARAWVCVEAGAEVTVPAGDFRFAALAPESLPGKVALVQRDLDQQRGLPAYEVFEPAQAEELTFHPGHNKISIWTWGDNACALPAGSTSATLVDGPPQPGKRALSLQPGDVLVFEEVLGAKTGNPADADHSHCQAVRLTSVTQTTDQLYAQPLLDVTWETEDALTFPLCVNARGGPLCADLEVGVARGNVVLVEHGRSLTWCGAEPEPLDPVPGPEPGEPGCPDPVEFGCPDELLPAQRPGYPPLVARYAPRLGYSPVTQSAPFPLPAQVAKAQGRQLAGVSDRARARLHELWRCGRLSDVDIEYLTVLFGAATLRRVRLAEHPRRALRELSARFGELLEAKLNRLAELIRRARAGYVLDSGGEAWEIGQTWGAEEGQNLTSTRAAFRGPAALAAQPDPRSALPAVTLDDTIGREWTPRRDLLDSRPTDRHFVGELDDEGLLRLRFGDGTNGMSPTPGTALSARYRIGNGSSGNVGREVINRIVFCSTRQDAITAIRNPLPATGGTDPEPLSEVRARAPQEVRHRLLRAVTAEDYATVASGVTGVQRAAADLRWTGSWYEAQVAIDPLGAEVATASLLDAVREALHPFRRIGHDLSVATATLVPLDVALCIDVQPDYVAGHVRAALLRALGALFTPDALTFGTPIRLSRLVAAAAAVPGVRSARVTKLKRLFGLPSGAWESGLLDIGPLEVAQLDNDPSRPENGRLTLDLRGGR
jgi:predicted phage baseplate assembly protein